MASLSNNLSVRVETSSDTSGIDKTESAIKRLGDSSEKSGKKVGTFGDTFKAILASELVNKAVQGVEMLTKKVIDFGISSVESFAESEEVMAQTEAAIKSTGGAAGMTAEAIADLASSWQKQTKYSDEAVQSAENILLTFTGIKDEVFPDTTAAVLDMATALEMDLDSAATQVAKALNSPIDGLSKLTKVGVVFTDEQKKQVEAMTAVGNIAGAQKVILKELQTEYGGSAKAAGETFAGKLAILKNSFDNVQESIGGAIVEGITPLMKKLADFVQTDQFQKWITDLTEWLKTNLPIAIQYVTDTLLPALKKIFDDIWPVIQTVLKWFSDLIVYISNNTWVIEALAIAFVSVKTAMFLTGAQAAFEGVMAAASTSYAGLAATMATPIVLTVAVGAALAAIALVYNAAQQALTAMDGMQRAQSDAIAVQQQAATLYQQQIKDNPADSAKAINAKANLIFTKASSNDLKQAYIKLMNRTDIDQATKDERAKYLFQANNSYATGTNFSAGGVALVGEEGPELVNLPRGSQVKTASETKSIMNRSTITIGTVVLGSADAVRTFFNKIDQDNILAGKGLSANRGL